MSNPSIEQLRRAVEMSEQIEKLENELRSILGSASSSPVATTGLRGRPPKVKGNTAASVALDEDRTSTGKRNRRKMSAEGRARIAAAQRARWAKKKKG